MSIDVRWQKTQLVWLIANERVDLSLDLGYTELFSQYLLHLSHIRDGLTNDSELGNSLERACSVGDGWLDTFGVCDLPFSKDGT